MIMIRGIIVNLAVPIDGNLVAGNVKVKEIIELLLKSSNELHQGET